MRTFAAIALLALAIPASASIAIFSDGRTSKIDAYAVEGELIRLTLQGGGEMSLPLRRIERIVDDEIVPVEVVEEEGGVFPKRSWRYSEASRPLWDSKYNDIITDAAKKFDVDAALVSAVIKAESDDNPRIVSHKGARGLMQLMPATARQYGVRNSYDPKSNLEAGVRHLKDLLNRLDLPLALAAYNAGEGTIKRFGGLPPYAETQNYVRSILRRVGAPASQPGTN